MLIVSKRLGFPPAKFSIGCSTGNCSTSVIEETLRRHFADLEQFEADPEAAFIVIT
jgi:hypothetical protein